MGTTGLKEPGLRMRFTRIVGRKDPQAQHQLGWWRQVSSCVYHSLDPDAAAIRLQRGADMDYLGVGDGRREESWHSDVAAGQVWTVECRLSLDLPQTLDIREEQKDTALLVAIS
jgi:hypothetical protein